MRISRIGLTALWLLAMTSVSAQEWVEVKPEARPGSRWWWLGSAVDSTNIDYNLSTYARAGLGSLEITPIYGVKGNEAHNIPYLSPRWMQLYHYTVKDAAEKGIAIDMNNGTGWPFGGPFVSIEQAAAKAVFETFAPIEGGKEITMDIRIRQKAELKQNDFALLSRLMAYGENGKVINLTNQVKDRRLRWKALEGKWQLIALFIGRTLQKVKRAAPGGEGYVIDHLDADVVKTYLQHFDKAFAASDAPYPRTFFNDSYEVYGADWSPRLLDEFHRRRGYRLEDHFPAFLREDGSEEHRRLVSDYRQTMSDMLLHHFTLPWTEWAHRHGSTTRNQAHGSPANLIDLYAAVDIPECEGFGLSEFNIKGLRKDSLTRKNFSDLSMLKYASSAAHLTGKPFVSSETFTWLTEHFRTSLSQCKPDMDLMFTAGVNHMFFHGTPYSPKEAPWPGWRFYASINMSPTNTIWKDAPAFFDYITRCQSFLQWGKPDNDFLVYLPIFDLWHELPGRYVAFDIHQMEHYAPQFIKSIHSIVEAGYDVDYISDAYIRSARCENGKVVTSGGTAYKAIIVPAVSRMPEATLNRLIRLAKQGATLIFIGHYPTDVPGFHQYRTRQTAFQRMISTLPDVASFEQAQTAPFAKGRIITGNNYKAVLPMTGVMSEALRTQTGVHWIRRSNPKGHHYFISNLQGKDVDEWVTLAVEGKDVMWFNPLDGTKGKAAVRHEGKRMSVRLQLKSGESCILQVTDQPLTTDTQWTYYEEAPYSLSLDHGWTLRFTDSQPVIEGDFPIDTPSSWTELPLDAAKTNMGTARYRLEVTLPDIKADDWIIDLGDVRESARLHVNGKEIATLWAVPFRTAVGKYLTPGKNVIEVDVTNLPGNRIVDYDKRGVEWRIFEDINIAKLNYKKGTYSHLPPMPSGLNGNVRLIPVFIHH